MRRHPIVGTFFLFVGCVCLLGGAFAPAGKIPGSPLPLEVVVPFVLWQLAVWCALLGTFFLRPRRGVRPAPAPGKAQG